MDASSRRASSLPIIPIYRMAARWRSGLESPSAMLAQNLSRLRRPALGEHEERSFFEFRRAIALEELLQNGQRLLRVGLHQAVDGDEFEILVRFGRGANRVRRRRARISTSSA